MCMTLPLSSPGLLLATHRIYSPSISLIKRSTMPASEFERTSTVLRRSARLLSVSASDVLAALDESVEIRNPRIRKRKHVPSMVADVIPRSANNSVLLEPQKKSQEKTKIPQGANADQETDQTSLKPRRKRLTQPEPINIIPEVEKKQTTFKGRLGYACLNTILRGKKPASDSIFCSRTCRLDSVKKNGIESVKDLGQKNVKDLISIIQWNEDNNIRFFRLSSEMFPFASHNTYGYSLDYCAPLLAEAGSLAKKYGHRLTTHPGQYTQLGSPNPSVVEAAIRELVYHCQMFDLMGLGPDSVMIIHGGGVYGDKPTTLKRLKENIMNLPEGVRRRLVLENDEMCYNAEDLLPICEELDVPLVFDYHHDVLFPSSIPPATIIQRANAIWARRGIKPKQHLSEHRPGAVTLMERRAHADRCEQLPVDLPDDMDLMIEAKDKEQAVLYLHRMYGLQPVIHESLRPATSNPSMRTNGRKSTKRLREKSTKQTGVTDEAPVQAETSSCSSGSEGGV